MTRKVTFEVDVEIEEAEGLNETDLRLEALRFLCWRAGDGDGYDGPRAKVTKVMDPEFPVESEITFPAL